MTQDPSSEITDRFAPRDNYPLAVMFLFTLYAALLTMFSMQTIMDGGPLFAGGLLGLVLGSLIGYYHFRPLWGAINAGIAGTGVGILAAALMQIPRSGFPRMMVWQIALAVLLATLPPLLLWRRPDALTPTNGPTPTGDNS
jgi:hypothetical protein